MTREPDIGAAVNNGPHTKREGAPHGAPAPSIPPGAPEVPVTPVASVQSESVAGQPADGAADGAAAAGAAGAAEDHERQLERDLEELTAKAEKADEYLELAKRTKADFENYRKRATREAAAAQERGVAKLA